MGFRSCPAHLGLPGGSLPHVNHILKCGMNVFFFNVFIKSIVNLQCCVKFQMSSKVIQFYLLVDILIEAVTSVSPVQESSLDFLERNPYCSQNHC